MTIREKNDDTVALESALRGYARKLQRAYGRRRASRILGVDSHEMWRWIVRGKCRHVALNVLHELGTSNPAEIRKLTRTLPGWRRGRHPS